jgi:hypothetical protein
MGGTLFRASAFLLIVFVFCQFDEYLELSFTETATNGSGFLFGGQAKARLFMQ